MADTSAHSPYRYGSDQGFFFGLYLTCMFVLSVLSVRIPFPPLSLLSMMMMFGVPFLIYRWLRLTYVMSKGTLGLSALWMQGIMIFICGTLLSAVPMVIYLKYINPGFIVDQLKGFIDLYAEGDWEGGRQSAEILQMMIDRKLVPSAISVTMEMVWLGVFSGSLLSLLMGLLARARSVPSSRRHDVGR